MNIFSILKRNRFKMGIFIVVFAFVILNFQTVFAQIGEWLLTDPLEYARQWHTSTLLQDGQVLVTGGQNFTNPIVSSEIYDPYTGLWTTTGSMVEGRYHHFAVLLLDGKVLIGGGQNNTTPLASAELYDPASGTWEAINPMTTPRNLASATLLPDGKVLVLGGCSGDCRYTNLNTAEIYDPVSGLWSTTAPMFSSRASHTATLLTNGKVLVAGGTKYYNDHFNSLSSSEIYDPSLGTWVLATSMNGERTSHTATLLPNGDVLVVGGLTQIYYYGSCSWNLRSISSAEIYDPETGKWVSMSPMHTVRSGHKSTLLPNGKVLVAGGKDYVDQCGVAFHAYSLNSAEIFDPVSGSWDLTYSMNNSRTDFSSALLPNGYVLIEGGYYENYPTSYSHSSSELFYQNYSPSANAGLDQSVDTLAMVTLDGSSSTDPNLDTLTFQWTQLDGPPVLLDSPTSVTPTFFAPDDPSNLTFSLVVSDSFGLISSADEVIISVINQAPIADGGEDLTAYNRKLVTLDGSFSYDPDHDLPLTYLWTQTGGTHVQLSDETAVNPTFTAPSRPTTLTFSLVVTDSFGVTSEIDETLVIVIKRSNNKPGPKLD